MAPSNKNFTQTGRFRKKGPLAKDLRAVQALLGGLVFPADHPGGIASRVAAARETLSELDLGRVDRGADTELAEETDHNIGYLEEGFESGEINWILDAIDQLIGTT